MYKLQPIQAITEKGQQFAPMSEQVVIQHIKYCRDLTRGFASRVFPGVWRHWCKALLEIATHTKSEKDKIALFEIHNLLAVIEQPATQEFCQYLDNGFVKFKNNTLNTLTAEERITNDISLLAEHSTFEETIAITSITHRAESFYAEQLWSLQQRFTLLNNGEKIGERSNPVGPIQFCDALRQIFSSLDIDTKIKIVCYKVFSQKLISQLDSLYSEVNQYLILQNLLPNLQAAFSDEKNTALQSRDAVNNDPFDIHSLDTLTVATADFLQDKNDHRIWSDVFHCGDVEYQTSLLNSIKSLQGSLNQQPVSVMNVLSKSNDVRPDLYVYSAHQLVGVLDRVQVLLLATSRSAFGCTHVSVVNLEPQPARELNQQIMRQVVIENSNGAISAEDVQTIDLVARLFEFILSDKNIPISVRTLLSYLHAPVLKLAIIDKEYFAQVGHPARILLNSLVDAGIRWVSNDGTDQFDIFDKIKITVFRALENFQHNLGFLTELLIEFNSYTHQIARRQEWVEERALEKVKGEQKLLEAKVQAHETVLNRINGRELPSAILLLLLQPWSDYLSFLILRYGDNSDLWHDAVKVIDNLLWSIEPKTLEIDKESLYERQGAFIAALERGFETIDYEQIKSRKLIEAVVTLQKMALQCRKAEPASESMRIKLETMAAEKAGSTNYSVLAKTAKELEVLEKLKIIEAGAWFEFSNGKRVKLIWINPKTNHYMLVNQHGKREALMPCYQLMDDILNGRTQIVTEGKQPFIERALEHIHKSFSN